MSGRYIVHSDTCYFADRRPYYLVIDHNRVYSIDKDTDTRKDITRFTSVKNAEGFITSGIWKAFKTIKEVKAYKFKLELDKSL